jgi:hypothetical protein
MYSVRREELPSGKAREQVWRRTTAGRGLTVAVKSVAMMDHPVCEREGEERKREGRERRKRGSHSLNFPPVTLTGMA